MELVNDLYLFCDRPDVGLGGRRGDDEAGAVTAGPATLAVLKEAVEALVLMLSPFTPHMSEELWEALGHADGVVAAGWPAFDETVARAEAVVVPVQVNGKLRARLTVPADVSQAELERLALEDASVRAHTDGRRVVKVVVARGRLVNVVVAS